MRNISKERVEKTIVTISLPTGLLERMDNYCIENNLKRSHLIAELFEERLKENENNKEG